MDKETYRCNKFLKVIGIVFGILFGILLVIMTVIVIYDKLTAQQTMSFSLALFFIIPFPLLFAAFVAIYAPQKYVWHNGVLQKYTFNRLKWEIDTKKQRSYVAQYHGNDGQESIVLAYERDNTIFKKRLSPAVDDLRGLYLQLKQVNDESFYIENRQLFERTSHIRRK